MAEVLVLPQTQEGAAPPPDDYTLRYSDLAPPEVAEPEAALAAAPSPPSQAPPEDFRARYSDLSPTPATDEVAPLPPPPEETPDYQSRYADLDPNQNVPATAAAVAEPIPIPEPVKTFEPPEPLDFELEPPTTDQETEQWLDRMGITDPEERDLWQPDSKAFKGERLPWTMGLAKWIDKIARPFTGAEPGELGTLENIAERGTYVPEPEEPSFLHAGIPTIPPQKGKAAQVAAGIGNLPIGFANFLLSPGGAATATSIGMLPKIGQILAGAGFTADQVKSFFQAETLQDRVTTALGSALLGLGTALHIRGGKVVKTREPKSSAREGATPTAPVSRRATIQSRLAEIEQRLGPRDRIEEGEGGQIRSVANRIATAEETRLLQELESTPPTQGEIRQNAGNNQRITALMRERNRLFLEELPKQGKGTNGEARVQQQINAIDAEVERLIQENREPLGRLIQEAAPKPRGGEKPSAIKEGKEPESVQTQPESRVESRQAKETSVSDRIQPAEKGGPEEVTPFDFRPALRTTEGIIEGEVGKTHADIYAAQPDPKAVRASDPEHVFLRGKEVVTRDQLEAQLGVRQSEQLIELQKLQEAARPKYKPDESAPKEGEFAMGPDPHGIYPEVAVSWRQDHAELVESALHKWKGSPTDARLHIKSELNNEPQPQSGGGKQMRQSAAALLWELDNNPKPTPKLYRGDNKYTKASQLYPWSESKAVAKEFAGKNGQIHELQPGKKGLRIADYLGKDSEKEWIVKSEIESQAVATEPDIGRTAEVGAAVEPSKPTEQLVTEAPSEPGIAAPAVEPAAVPGAGGAMGAAGAGEKLATYEQRKFGKRLMSDEELVASFKEDLGNQYYEPIPNNITFENAVALVNERGIPESIRITKDMTNGLPFHLRSAMGQFMVKRMNAAIKNLGESPDATRLQNHAIDTAEWLADFGTKLGQGVQSFAAYDRLSPEGKLIKVRQDAKKLGVELTEKQEADIMKMAQEIETKAEGMPRNEAVLKLNSYIANIKGFDVKDLPLGIYYGNMLSGYNTHIVNAFDTFLNVNSEINGLAMTNPRAAMTIYAGLLRGYTRGSIDALHALTEGRMITDQKYLDQPRLMEVAKFGQKGGVPIKVTGMTSAAIKAFAESKAAYPLNAWKYVSRLMSASDTVMFRGAQEGRAALLAHRLAVNEGMKGQALHNRVNEILGLDVKAKQTFEQQARAEGYKGAKLKSRVAELSRLSRPEDINADAIEFASEASYNHKPHGFVGYLGDTAGKVTNKVPVLKTVMPFTQIVANVTNRGLNYSPLGFKRAFRGYSFEPPPVGDARTAMLMRASMGTSALGIVLGATAAGLMDIHGNGPSDREKRRQMLNRGWKPYSFQFGDHYFSFLPTPVGLEMSVLGNMKDSQRYNELGQKDAFTRAGYAISRLGSTVFSQSFLSGMSTVFEALSGTPGETIAGIKQFLSSTAGTFLSPKIVNDIYRLFDPKQYRAETIVGDLLRNTPMSAKLNMPTLNAFGEPVTLPNNRFVSKASQDPIWQFVARTGIRISVPSRTTTVPDGEGGKRRITPEEYYTYLQDSGQQLKTYISDNMDSLEGMEKEDLQDKLSEEAKAIRKRVKGELFQ